MVRVPVDALREEVQRILHRTDRWNGKVWKVQVAVGIAAGSHSGRSGRGGGEFGRQSG
jgi:hypothetical protein